MSNTALELQLNSVRPAAVTTATKMVLKVEYEGTRYNGFQLQTDAPTVQAELEDAIFKLTGEELRVIPASRTDTGVHARGQIVSFRTSSSLPPATFVSGLNYYLPKDIAVKEARRIDNEFDIRKRALSREYEYYILNSRTRSPLMRRTAWVIAEQIDTALMRQAAATLLGEHDFASFTTVEDCRIKKTVHHVYSAGVEKAGDMITFKIAADAFLHHQVRNTIGAIVRVGMGALTPEEFVKIMEARKPGLAGPRAPACGLCLVKINYPGEFHENV